VKQVAAAMSWPECWLAQGLTLLEWKGAGEEVEAGFLNGLESGA